MHTSLNGEFTAVMHFNVTTCIKTIKQRDPLGLGTEWCFGQRNSKAMKLNRSEDKRRGSSLTGSVGRGGEEREERRGREEGKRGNQRQGEGDRENKFEKGREGERLKKRKQENEREIMRERETDR